MLYMYRNQCINFFVFIRTNEPKVITQCMPTYNICVTFNIPSAQTKTIRPTYMLLYFLKNIPNSLCKKNASVASSI